MIHDRRTRARIMIGQIKVSRGGRAANEHLNVDFRSVGWSIVNSGSSKYWGGGGYFEARHTGSLEDAINLAN